MKKLLVVAVLASMIVSCQESKENVVQKLPKQYDKRIGEQIPLDVAYRWIRNFNNITMGGRTSSVYSIEAGELTNVIGVVEDRLGVVLHHGIDDSGEQHLLMFAIDEDGILFKNTILDLSTGETVNEAIAKSWTSKYAQEHPATPWYHFFGSDTFAEIKSNEVFDYIDVVRGLNEDNEEQILLFVYNTDKNAGGKVKGESVVVYDGSFPCPPCSN